MAARCDDRNRQDGGARSETEDRGEGEASWVPSRDPGARHAPVPGGHGPEGWPRWLSGLLRPGDSLLVCGTDAAAGALAAARTAGVPLMIYTDDPLPPRSEDPMDSPKSAAAGGAAAASPSRQAMLGPRLVLHPTSSEVARGWLGHEHCSGLLLTTAADLDHLLARRPDLSRPRGGRPCWILLFLPAGAEPGPWAQGWARVQNWSPGVLPPVIVPEHVLSQDSPPGGATEQDMAPAVAHALRARRTLLRMLEEPVPLPVVMRLPPAGADIHGYRTYRTLLEDVPVWWLTGGRT